jgi:hypothetical protein
VRLHHHKTSLRIRSICDLFRLHWPSPASVAYLSCLALLFTLLKSESALTRHVETYYNSQLWHTIMQISAFKHDYKQPRHGNNKILPTLKLCFDITTVNCGIQLCKSRLLNMTTSNHGMEIIRYCQH